MGDEEGKGLSGEEATALNAKLAEAEGKATTAEGKLSGLTSANEEMSKKNEVYERDLMSDSYLKFLEDQKGGGIDDHKGGGGKTPNFDEMTQSQLAEHFTATLNDAVGALTKKLEGQFGEYDDRVGKAFAEIDVSMTAIKHKDFGDALSTSPDKRTDEQKSMINITRSVAKDNPTWSTEKCVKDARRQMKETQDSADKEQAVKADEDRKMLSEKGGSSSNALYEKGMGEKEASDLAWKTAMGNKDSL